MKINIRKLIISIAIPLIVGGVSAFLSRDAMMQFESMNQPPLSPPGWLFPIVWTILYILMGVSSYLISESAVGAGGAGNSKPKSDAESVMAAQQIYYLQLLLNFLWPVFFFNFGWYLFAFFELLVLWIAVFVMIRRFAEISKLAAYLNIPYLIWLTFAAYLNLGVWWLNR